MLPTETQLKREFIETAANGGAMLIPNDPKAEAFRMRRLPLDAVLKPDSPFHEIHAIWNGRRIDDGPPRWEDFDFTDFRGWHSRLKISVFPDDQPDPEFRIMGEKWRDLVVRNLAGLRFSEMLPGQFELQFGDHFREIRSKSLIGHALGPIAAVDLGLRQVEVLELPVSRNGEKVGGLFHCLHIEEPRPATKTARHLQLADVAACGASLPESSQDERRRADAKPCAGTAGC